jgi:hypothetical protein
MFPDDENGTETVTDITNAQVRLRINHSRTERSGWRFETTVEISGSDNAEALSRMMIDYERLTDQIGRDECEARNVSDQIERARANERVAA